MDANLAAVIATQDAVILGRRSYTEWAQFWPSSQIQPFATFINGVTKYVATSTPLDRDWANATVLDGGLVEIRSGSQAAARRRCRRPRKYLGRAGAARRRRCRRTQARDSAEDRRPRTTTPRRLAIDSARIDPKRDLTDWLSARRLSRYSLGAEASRLECGHFAATRPQFVARETKARRAPEGARRAMQTEPVTPACRAGALPTELTALAAGF